MKRPKRVYRPRPHSLDEIASTFIAGLPLEDQLQASLDWNERKQDVAKQLKIESEAANLLNQGLMKLETDRVAIVTEVKRAESELKAAAKRVDEWQARLAAHDKMAAPFLGKPARKKPAKRKRVKDMPAVAQAFERTEAALDAAIAEAEAAK